MLGPPPWLHIPFSSDPPLAAACSIACSAVLLLQGPIRSIDMTSAAYSRASKLPGERRLMRSLTSKMEPKKLGVGVIAGCCLALLTYVSLAKLFAIYSPVFASTANTSALMQHNSPPPSSKPSVPETEAIPPQETLLAAAGGGGNNGDAAVDDDPVDLPETAGSEEPALLPEAAVDVKRKETAAVLGEEPGMKPRMVIVSRAGPRRKLLNLDEVAAAASELGFNVTVAEAAGDDGVDDVPAQVVNSADVLLAVHGAGLAASQVVFLPAKAVVVQIVPPPWGETMATNLDGQPAPGMPQLRYVEYNVGDEETKGWQHVSVSLTKFRLLLLQVLDTLQE